MIQLSLPMLSVAGVCVALWAVAASFYFSRREAAAAREVELLAMRYYVATGACIFGASLAAVALSFQHDGVFEMTPIVLFSVFWLLFWGATFAKFPRMKKAPAASVRRNVVFYVGTGGVLCGIAVLVCALLW